MSSQFPPPGFHERGSGWRKPPGGENLTAPFLLSWGVLAGASLAAGLCWRFAGEAPPVMVLLDGISLALWLTAAWLTPAWDRVLRRQWRHNPSVELALQNRILNSAAFLPIAALLALAPAGVLIAYDGSAKIIESLILEVDFPGIAPVTISVRLGPFLLAALLLAGTTVVIASTALLLACRRLFGFAHGSAFWIILIALANLPLIAGTALPWFPTSLGGAAQLGFERLAHAEEKFLYFGNLAKELIGWPLLILLGSFALLVLAQLTRRGKQREPSPLWLAAVAGVIFAAARMAALTAAWISDMSVRHPGEWLGVFAVGLWAFWLFWWIEAWRQSRITMRLPLYSLAGWSIFAVLSWTCLTYPNILADQVEHKQVLIAACVSLPTLIAGLVLIQRLSQVREHLWPPAGNILLLIALLVLLIPLNAAGQPLSLQFFQGLTAALANPESAVYSYWVLACLAAVCLLGFKLRRRRLF
ncbi:hypothetical protein IIA79_01655 [bacterium]|nr:hypothetical protein [bacterium]